MRKKTALLICSILLPLVECGCGSSTNNNAASTARIKFATTTSTENSGLLSVLLPPFEKKSGVKVDVIAVGTGKALKLAENGDVDIILVHAPKAEDIFIRNGFGVKRHEVMYNYFVIVGPTENPAGIVPGDAAAAMRTIYEAGCIFVSRGDESGTHIKERYLWELAGIDPAGDRYLATGQAMGQTLITASEKRGYCLTDRATYLALKEKTDLAVLCDGDPELRNPYSLIAVKAERHPHVQAEHAAALIQWFTSAEGQSLISNFKKHGQQLFHPSAGGRPR